MAELSYLHRYEPPNAAGRPTVLALHGTGGDEHDLIPLVQTLMPGAGILSPRGNVLERGMARFFRRIAEGVFDVADLQRRTIELADFVSAAAKAYAFDPARVIAVGFSNGANIAASALLMRPKLLAAAVLFRAMVPFTPSRAPVLPDTPVLLLAGHHDPLVPHAQVERLAEMLNAAGAQVTLEWEPAGHDLTDTGVAYARQWLADVAR